MEASVRYVQVEALKLPAKYANRPGLVIEAEGKLVCIVSDGHRIRAIQVPEREILKFRKVPHNGGVYPNDKFLDQLVEISQHRPATKDAREWIIKFDPTRGKTVHVELDPEKSGGRGATIAEICEELDIDPKRARKFLRSRGLRAPYTNFNEAWKLLRTAGEKVKRRGEVETVAPSQGTD